MFEENLEARVYDSLKCGHSVENVLLFHDMGCVVGCLGTSSRVAFIFSMWGYHFHYVWDYIVAKVARRDLFDPRNMARVSCFATSERPWVLSRWRELMGNLPLARGPWYLAAGERSQVLCRWREVLGT